MLESQLTPFLRENLDILFVGLNPALGSSRNKHYFSVNQAFWNQLYAAGLITQHVDKSRADEQVFGATEINHRNRSFGITDLVPTLAESNSRRVRPTQADCAALANTIVRFQPRTVVLLHQKVVRAFLTYLGHAVPAANAGALGCLLDTPTAFFAVAFPHGNGIPSENKIEVYRAVRVHLEFQSDRAC